MFLQHNYVISIYTRATPLILHQFPIKLSVGSQDLLFLAGAIQLIAAVLFSLTEPRYKRIGSYALFTVILFEIYEHVLLRDKIEVFVLPSIMLSLALWVL